MLETGPLAQFCEQFSFISSKYRIIMIEKKQKQVNLHTNPDFWIEVIDNYKLENYKPANRS